MKPFLRTRSVEFPCVARGSEFVPERFFNSSSKVPRKIAKNFLMAAEKSFNFEDFVESKFPEWPSLDGPSTFLFQVYNELHNTEPHKLKVTATKKFDGSNLGVVVAKDKSGEYKTVSLEGRNAPIWTLKEAGKDIFRDESNKADVLKLKSYGNAGKLDLLPLEIRNFAVSVAKELGLDALFINGEAFRCDGQKYASWHPFALRFLSNGEWVTKFLTNDLHKLFQRLCGETEFKSFQDVKSFLLQQKKHAVFPPLLLATGTFGEVMANLTPVLLEEAQKVQGLVDQKKASTPSKIVGEFEGVFVVPDVPFSLDADSHVFSPVKVKIRDGEQRLREYREWFTDPEALALYDCFEKIQSASIRYRYEAPVEKSPEVDDRLNHELLIAAEHVLSKKQSISDIPQKERRKVALEFIPEVVTELLSEYKKNGTSIPWDDAQINKQASVVIMKLVFSKTEAK